MRWTILLALLPTLALAQSQSAPRPEDLGTITGHITCADTQRPARFAHVSIVPVKLPKEWNTEPVMQISSTYVPVQTDLNGAYTIPNVHPGQYFLVVAFAGYVTPIRDFSDEERTTPTPEIQQRIQSELQVVTVSPHSTVQADAVLHRGGSISGTVLYDDGSPAVRIEINLLRRDNKGELRIAGESYDSTDSHGRFNLDSLPPGEYVICAKIQVTGLHKQKMTFANGEVGDSTWPEVNFTLPVYSGNVFRQKSATAIKLEEGEDTDDAGITIALSRLHDVSGTLAATDGHPVGMARAELLFADTGESFVGVNVVDGEFHFPLVPEGSYILSVPDARDIVYVDVPNPADSPPGTSIVGHTTRSYESLQQPLTVQTDVQSLNLTLPDKPSTTPTE